MPERDAGAPGASTTTAQVLLLVDRNLDRAYRLAGLILGDAEDARDATQDAIVRAWRSASSLRDGDRFQAWFDRILVNACRDRLRRRARIRFIELDEAAPDGRDPFRAVVDGDEVLRALHGLEPDLRTVVALAYWADLSLQDVAARTGWPVGTVKSRLHRALERLRAALGADAEAERGR